MTEYQKATQDNLKWSAIKMLEILIQQKESASLKEAINYVQHIETLKQVLRDCDERDYEFKDFPS